MHPDASALDRLIADVSAAMHAAEAQGEGRCRGRARRRRGRSWPLAVAVFALSVPSAVAIHAVVTPDRRVDVPVMRKPIGRNVPPAGATVAIATGAVHRAAYTFVAQRCEHGGVVTLGTGFIMGRAGGRGGGGFSPCPRRVHPQPLVQTLWTWTGGQTWFYGITQARVASVELRLVRRKRRPDGTQASFSPSRVTVRTRRFDIAAVRQGRLPPGYRLFVLFRPRRSDFTGLTARDAAGRVLLRCARRACDRVAFQGGRPTR